MGKRSNASKFPVARIKKIMQADEDVGKVAQATPVVISKALELFLADIVNAAATETRSKGGKKVTAYHLKRAVHQTQTLDFLKDIVEKVPDPAGAAAAAPAAGGSSAEAGAGAAPLKRRESEEYGSGSAAESGDAVPKRRRKA